MFDISYSDWQMFGCDVYFMFMPISGTCLIRKPRNVPCVRKQLIDEKQVKSRFCGKNFIANLYQPFRDLIINIWRPFCQANNIWR